VKPPSCAPNNAALTTCQNGVSCCAASRVPGGDFRRNFDGEAWPDDTFTASVSAFYLDKFEVTVGRFRQFLSAYEAIDLEEGDGKSPHIADDAGWKKSFALPTKSDLVAALTGCSGTTWSDIPNADADQLPINCVPFPVAYAFCIWDGGRLPTEAEWNFAASGGSEQRVYPWKAPVSGPLISAAFANYGDSNPGPVGVGLTPAGDGRWGQSDLAGNVTEWVLDFWGELPQPCSDCVNTTADLERVVRGGYFENDESTVVAAFRTSSPADFVYRAIGFRCARD
jgi:formylglycine-generating enzyme required for sulfatase activity